MDDDAPPRGHGNGRRSRSPSPSSAPRRFADAYTPKEAERIGRMLENKLTKTDTKQRAGPGGRKLTYLESWKVIDLANHIFGWDGWSCQGTFGRAGHWGGVMSWGGLLVVGDAEGDRETRVLSPFLGVCAWLGDGVVSRDVQEGRNGEGPLLDLSGDN